MANSLPYNPTGFTSQPMQFNYNNPPFVPQSNKILPMFSQYIVSVAAMVANEASAKATIHPGRVFLFNQLSDNNYANQKFVNAVELVFDLVVLALFKREANSIDTAIPIAVGQAMALCSAVNFSLYPDLRQHVDQNIYADAVTKVNMMQSLLQEITHAKTAFMQQQGMGQPMMGQPMMGHGQPMMSSGPNMGPMSSGNNFPQGRMYPTNPQMPQQAFQGHSVFNSTPGQMPGMAPAQQGPVDVVSGSGKYDYLKNSINTPTPPAAPVHSAVNQSAFFNTRVPAPEPVVAPVVMQQENLEWRPSILQSHPLTCDTRYQKVINSKIKHTDNNEYVVSIIINLSEEEMDQKRHTIGFVDRAVTSVVPSNFNTRQEAFADGVGKFIERNEQSRNENEVTETEEMVDYQYGATSVADTFLSSAIFRGRVLAKKVLQQKESDMTAFGMNLILASPVLVDTEQSVLFDQLDSASSYARLQSILKTALTSPASSNVSKQLAARVEKLFTKEINSLLRNSLSVPHNMDSFIEDATDMIQFLQDKEGSAIAEAYRSAEVSFSNKYLNQLLLDEVITDSLKQGLDLTIDDAHAGARYAEGDSLECAFLTQCYSLTFLQVNSTDISVDTSGKIAGALTEQYTPVLYNLAKNIFSTKSENDQLTAHTLIITNDNVIYELHKGMLNKDCILISKFH
jgi:hypothetical protein